MDTNFTTKSREVLSAAAMNASTAGNAQIETPHFLKALMDQRDGIAVALLKAAGAGPDDVSVRASSAIKALPASSGSSVAQPQFSRGALQMVSAAQQEAETLGDRFVSTEHLLLALAADAGAAGTILRSAG